VHLSDISWNDTGEQAVRDYQKGQEVTTVVLAIDPERERISLGIKQLEDDPFNDYVAVNDRGAIVTGTVVEVTEKDAIIKLAEEVEGVLRASELSQERVEDARTVLKAGDEVEVKITAVDRKNRTLNLSVKAKDIEDEREAMREHKEREQESSAATTIGDLIREKMDQQGS
jgi:small subunit ribosomal protein S1